MNDSVPPSAASAPFVPDAAAAATGMSGETVKKSRKTLWFSLAGAGVVVVGAAVTASLILIAPGTEAAGTNVGWQTGGIAASSIDHRLDTVRVTVSDGTESATFSARELGAEINATELASEIHNERPFWNVTKWFAEPLEANFTFNNEQTTQALEDKLAAAYLAPSDAEVVFETGSKKYTVVAGASGLGIDTQQVQEALQVLLNEGEPEGQITVETVEVLPAISDETATSFSETLNKQVAVAGFYVDDERTVEIAPEEFASWVTVVPEGENLAVEVDQAKIDAVTAGLAEQVDRESQNGSAVVDLAGNVLVETVPGQSKRVLKSTDGLGAQFAAAIQSGDAKVKLKVEETPYEVNKTTRSIEVNVTTQTLTLKENGRVVDSWLVSTGLAGADTQLGRHKVFAHVREQTMRGRNAATGVSYDIPNVQYAMYFNGDQAFHGVHWRDNWGERGSAGCVGMSNDRAKQLYEWSPDGIDILIHE